MRTKKGMVSIIVIIGVIMMSLWIVNALNVKSVYPVITQEKAEKMIENNSIVSVMFCESEAVLKTETNTYMLKNVTDSNMLRLSQLLYGKNISTEYVESFKTGTSPLLIVFVVFTCIGIVVLIISTLLSTASKSLMEEMDKNGTRSIMPNKGGLRIGSTIPKVGFKDVKGCKELKNDAKGLISYLQNPYKYSLMGARMPKGIILYGPPGTGKTLVAKAIAGEAGVPFLSVSGSDFIEKYVGVGASRVRELFTEAKKCSPCIVFIDEIDAVADKRGKSQNSEKDQTINAILTEMDGFNESTGVMVIAATNRIDMLDNAILRPGRFDKHLAVPLPDKDDRYEILKLHSSNKKLDESVNLKVLAAQTSGFSGAALESLLNEATLIAVNNDKKVVSLAEIDKAFFKIVMEGDVKDNQENRHEEELKLVAYHEAGHTLITKLLTNDNVPKVTILSSTSGAGGVTFHVQEDGHFSTKSDLEHHICISYGGRAAEEVLYGSPDLVTVGASSDIQAASKQLKEYLMTYGMSSKFGMLDISVFEQQSLSNEDLINEASELSLKLYQKTLDTLKSNKDTLDKLAEALLKNETLLEDQIDDIINPKDYVSEEMVECEE